MLSCDHECSIRDMVCNAARDDGLLERNSCDARRDELEVKRNVPHRADVRSSYVKGKAVNTEDENWDF